MESMEIIETASSSIPLNGTEMSDSHVFMTDQVRNIVEPAIWFVMLPLNVLGVLTNVINARVFVEQGVRNDSTNIGFVCLSVWDLLGCATLIPYSLCFIVRYVNGIFDHFLCTSVAVQLVFPHKAFQHIGAWTTVYISLIRCSCVLFPLKVKSMFTPKKTLLYMTGIFVFYSSMQVVSALLTDIVWTHLPSLNMTVPILIDKEHSREYVYYKFIVINQILPVLAVVIVSINTALLGQKLMQVKKWRQRNSSAETHNEVTQDDKSKALASKDIELIKFINIVTTIFLVCVLMAFIPSVVMMTVHGVSMTGVNSNLFFVSTWVWFLFYAINSSINFFFYIRVSSRYKTAFASAFKMCARWDETKS